MSDAVDNKLWRSVPRFAKGTCLDSEKAVSAALATEIAQPLPLPPQLNDLNAEAYATIRSRPDLFKIVTPIKVERFERYLENHPNRKYVESVCRGLRDGFWPWANGDDPDMWKTYDNSRRPIRDLEHMDFVLKQREKEIQLGRWSQSFGFKLLPGMYSSPIGVATKPKLRLVNDHSQDPYSPNSFITDIEPSFPLDTIPDLVSVLFRARRNHGKHRKLVLWKSDVKTAYRRMPMHPLWQIRQIATVEGKHHVDRCNAFGSRAGGWVWASFISLVLWIAIKVKKIDDLLGYVDDDFSWDFADNTSYYPKYGKYLPAKQAQYLELWDELGIPHEQEKQESGSPLTIIGFEVDPNSDVVGVRLPASRRTELFEAIDDLAQEGQKCTLLKLQQVAGLIEWALVVNPFARPGLSGIHDAMSGRQNIIPINSRIIRELRWLKAYIQSNNGGVIVQPLKDWGGMNDIVNYVDASPSGVGIWIPSLRQGFQTKIGPQEVHKIGGGYIMDLESFAIVAALEYAARCFRPTNVVIFSDSQSSVDMFESLNTKDENRNILITAFVNIQEEFGLRCRVFHISGQDNEISDALSRFENHRLRRVNITTIQQLETIMMFNMLAKLRMA
jgi:hypothetical protein